MNNHYDKCPVVQKIKQEQIRRKNLNRTSIKLRFENFITKLMNKTQYLSNKKYQCYSHNSIAQVISVPKYSLNNLPWKQ